jgi:hypothetical protein
MGPLAFIRRHPPPAAAGAKELETSCAGHGYVLDLMNGPGAIHTSLARLAEQGSAEAIVRWAGWLVLSGAVEGASHGATLCE